MPKILGLRPYQTKGTQFLTTQKRAMLADEMGLGKSAQLLRAAEGKTLVVAPAMVLDGGTWHEETRKWAPNLDLTTVSYSSLCQRQKSKVLPVPRPEYDVEWNTIIFDEAHTLKNRKTNWTKAALRISSKADRVYLATGTPLPNWPHEIFSLLQILEPDKARPGRELGSYHRWTEQWFRLTPNHFNKHATDIGGLLGCSKQCQLRPLNDPCDHHRQFVEENFGTRFLQRFRDDVLTDLPPLEEIEVRIPMAPEQDKAYQGFKKEMLAEIDGQLDVAWSSSAAHTKMDKVCTGVGVVDPETPAHADHSNKLDRLKEDLARRTSPTLVMAHYRQSVEAAARVASDLGKQTEYVHGGCSRKQRAAAIQRFKDGEVDVLVGSLDTLSEGVTLVQADVVIFLEKSYRPSRNQQAMRRIHRIGQTKPCTVIDYVSVTAKGKNTTDTAKRAMLAEKTDAQMRVLSCAKMLSLLE